MNLSHPIGFGIIGLGTIAEFHYQAIRAIPGCAFIGGYNHTPEKCSAFCQSHGGIAYPSLAALLADPWVCSDRWLRFDRIRERSIFHLELLRKRK